MKWLPISKKNFYSASFILLPILTGLVSFIIFGGCRWLNFSECEYIAGTYAMASIFGYLIYLPLGLISAKIIRPFTYKKAYAILMPAFFLLLLLAYFDTMSRKEIPTEMLLQIAAVAYTNVLFHFAIMWGMTHLGYIEKEKNP